MMTMPIQLTVRANRWAKSLRPAPMAWPTKVVPATATPEAGR